MGTTRKRKLRRGGESANADHHLPRRNLNASQLIFIPYQQPRQRRPRHGGGGEVDESEAGGDASVNSNLRRRRPNRPHHPGASPPAPLQIAARQSSVVAAI